MGENMVKIKLLKLYELLLSESSSSNPITTNQLCDAMKEMGGYVDRRTLTKDIALLRDNGYDIQLKKVGKQNGYYLKQERWKRADLRVIIDAIHAANFIPGDETDRLIEHLIQLAPKEERESLVKSGARFNNVKHSNHDVSRTIDLIVNALDHRTQISFCYFDLNEKIQKVFRKNGERYIVEPIALIYDSDFYYLMTYNSHHDAITNYRVDRMSDAREETDKISRMAMHQITSKKPERFTTQAFRMFGGEIKRIWLEFDDDLVGVVIDKFGERIRMERIAGTNRIRAKVEIQESQVWQAWLGMFQGRMRIVPEEK